MDEHKTKIAGICGKCEYDLEIEITELLQDEKNNICYFLAIPPCSYCLEQAEERGYERAIDDKENKRRGGGYE